MKDSLKKNVFFNPLLKSILDFFREIKFFIIKMLLLSFRVFKVKNNRILVVSYYGKGFGDNCKYVISELLKDRKSFEIYWAVSDMNESFPDGILKVKLDSLLYFYILATSKIWLDNARKSIYIIKRPNQVYFQLWHGCLPIKKVEFDAIDRLNKFYIKAAIKDNKMINYIVSNSRFCSDVLFRKSFKYKNCILEYGSPREDILFNKNYDIVLKVKEAFSISPNKKILLYAPTFRNNYCNQYDIDYDRLISILKKQTNHDWIILFRLHPNVSSKTEDYNIVFNDDLINASDYNDVQELIVSSDLVITDYSSLMFDSMLASIPTILYANDFSTYGDERGFYFDFSELPFPMFHNNDELSNFDYNKLVSEMNNKYIKFSNKIGFFKGGNASKKVANCIKEVINYEKN